MDLAWLGDIEPAWIAAGAASAGGLAAWWATINGVRTFRQTRTDSKGRSRPMLAAELRMVPYHEGMLALVIRNLGATIARKVQVTFDPPVPDTDDPQSVARHLKRRYAQPISTFTPGVELSNLWFVGKADAAGDFQNLEPMPDRCTVTIEYEAADGTAYTDEFVIDVDLMKGETFSISSTAPEERIKEIALRLKSIDGSLKTIAQAVQRVDTQSGGHQGLPDQILRQLLGRLPAIDEVPGENVTERHLPPR